MAENGEGEICIPILEKKGSTLSAEPKTADFNKNYEARCKHIEEAWCNNPKATPLQSQVELGNDTQAMVAYAAHGVCTSKPLDNLPKAHKETPEYNCHYDLPIPSDSPLMTHEYGKAETIEDLLGIHDKNKSKASTSVVTQPDVTSLQNLKEMLSNGA